MTNIARGAFTVIENSIMNLLVKSIELCCQKAYDT